MKSTKKEMARREEILKRLETQNLRQIQKDYPASLGSLARFRDGHSPKSYKIRKALGLPVYQETEVCPECGIVHSKICKPSFEKRLKQNCPEDAKYILFYYRLLKSE